MTGQPELLWGKELLQEVRKRIAILSYPCKERSPLASTSFDPILSLTRKVEAIPFLPFSKNQHVGVRTYGCSAAFAHRPVKPNPRLSGLK